MRYPADPPTIEEIIAVMRQTSDDRDGFRLRALIILLWRGGLRIQEALELGERDLDPRHGSLLVRNGKGGRRREIGMDAWGWQQLRPVAGRPQRRIRSRRNHFEILRGSVETITSSNPPSPRPPAPRQTGPGRTGSGASAPRSESDLNSVTAATALAAFRYAG